MPSTPSPIPSSTPGCPCHFTLEQVTESLNRAAGIATKQVHPNWAKLVSYEASHYLAHIVNEQTLANEWVQLHQEIDGIQHEPFEEAP